MRPLKVSNIFNNRTGLPYYDEMLENPEAAKYHRGLEVRVVPMSPRSFLQEVAKMQGTSLQRQYEMVSPLAVEELRITVEMGVKLPMPVLDYARREHEGRHRAVLAEKLGIPQIPVLVVKEV